MVATASVRTRVRDELLNRISLHPAMVSADGNQVPVDKGDPGKAIEHEHCFVERITGTRNVVFLQAGRKTIEDNFTITVVYWVSTPGLDGAEADDRVEQMSNSGLDVLADDPTLGDLEGLMWATQADSQGPTHVLTDEGAVSVWIDEVQCKARYE